MCIFTGPGSSAKQHVHVRSTRIFARLDAGPPAVQSLAYEMHLDAASDVAMVLPLPVAPGTPESGVTFVDLSAAPTLFDELDALFPPPPQPRSLGAPAPRAAPKLAVQRVGAFVASYVPSVADFTRLDPRFRLSDAVLRALPAYADWGFAVFALAPGAARIHPMGLRFPTRAPSRLFFPTMHVHDGAVHERAEFDHQLYFQGDAAAPADAFAERSEGLPPESATQRTRGLLDRARVHRFSLGGTRPNRDTWLDRR